VFCTEFRAVVKRSQIHPNGEKRTKTCVYGQMLWIGSTGCENFRHDFVPQTSALIAPFWRVLHRVLCSRETVPNAPKLKETHQNVSSGSNGVDRERSLRKIRTWLRTTNFCITIFARFASSFYSTKMVSKAPTTNKTHLNMSLGSNGVDREHSLQKNSDTTLGH